MDFVRCPQCMVMVWEDLHAIVHGIPTRFRCIRCGNVIALGKCSHCDTKDWIRLSDIFEKEGKKPVIRFQCGNCTRIIGVLLD